MKKRVFVIAALALFTGASIALSADLFGRGKYETAQYEVTKTDGPFEIRKYPEIVVVSAPMASGAEKNSAFRSLFQYISGQNETGAKISMTTPVFTSPQTDTDTDKDKAEGAAEAGIMSFVVPADVAKAGAPKADSDAVKISKRAAGTFAVYRYSGRWTEARETRAQETLEGWMKKEGLQAKGEFEKANYDPPFTPWFLRRNEVLVRIAS